MPYTPSPTDPTNPTDNEKASSMAAEFRALKSYIVSTLLPNIASKLGGVGGVVSGPIGAPSFVPTDGATNRTAAYGFTNGNGPSFGVAGTAAGNVAEINVAGSTRLRIGSTGITEVLSGLAVAGTANFAGVTNAAQLNAVGAKVRSAPGLGAIDLAPGDATRTGYLELYNAAGVRTAYIGYASATVVEMFGNGLDWNFNTKVIAPNFEGFLIGTAQNAQQVPWTGVTGRPTALSQFTNDIGAGSSGSGSVSYSQVIAALGFTPYRNDNPAGYVTGAGSVAFASGANSANYATNLAGGVCNASSVTSAGLVRGNGGGVGLGAITVSTGGPSAGNDGDIHLQVAP